MKLYIKKKTFLNKKYNFISKTKMSNNIIQSSSSSTLSNNLIEGLKVDGETIVKIDPRNNLVHLTHMMQKGGKESSNYLQTSRAKNFITALEDDLGTLIIQIIHGDGGGTWVHPDLAVDAAMWISPEFGLAVCRLVREFLTGRVTTEQSQEACRGLLQGMRSKSLNIKSKKNTISKKGRERKFQEELAVKLEDAEMEVACETGIIDILTPNFVVEVKVAKSFKHAIGQVIVYGLEYPKARQVIALYDHKNVNKQLIINTCTKLDKLDIDVWFLD